jgi:competence protein ComEC
LKTEGVSGPNPDLWPKALARVTALEFRSAPLLTATCWFALGEVMARNWQPAAILLVATLLLSLLTVAALRWSPRTAIVPSAAVWMAIGCWCAQIQPVPPTQQALANYADGLSRQIRGRVVRVRELSPQLSDSDHDKEMGWWAEKEAEEDAATAGALSVDIQVDSIEEVTPDISRMIPMTGGVRMNVIADKLANSGFATRATGPAADPAGTVAAIAVLPALKCGDIVEAPMRIRLTERYHDPGAWQYADYLLSQGIGAHASVRAAKIALLNEPGARLSAGADHVAQMQCRIYAAQSWASGRMLSYVRSKVTEDCRRFCGSARTTQAC